MHNSIIFFIRTSNFVHSTFLQPDVFPGAGMVARTGPDAYVSKSNETIERIFKSTYDTNANYQAQQISLRQCYSLNKSKYNGFPLIFR